MPTLHENFLGGTITDNPLTNVATTINSTAFANLPVVSAPNVLWIVLDPLAAAGAPEVVKVTAHTASATSVTVQRGQQGSSARQHAQNTVWRHVATADEYDDLPSNILTTQGDIIYASADGVAARLARGTNGYPLVAGATVPSYAQLGTTGIADNAITTVKIGDSQVTSAKIADGTIASGDLASAVVDGLLWICTSGTRPGTPVEGRRIYETDTNKYLVYDGTGWRLDGGSGWVTFTPSWANVTLNNGTTTGRYRYVEGGIRVIAELVFGSTTSVTGTVNLTIPNSETAATGMIAGLGHVQIYDSSANGVFVGQANVSSGGTTIGLWGGGGGVMVSATVPITWAVNDALIVDIVVRLT